LSWPPLSWPPLSWPPLSSVSSPSLPSALVRSRTLASPSLGEKPSRQRSARRCRRCRPPIQSAIPEVERLMGFGLILLGLLGVGALFTLTSSFKIVGQAEVL